MHPLLKLYTMIGNLFVMMCTYLIGFCFMECGPIASGLSFNGYDSDGNAKHDRVRSVNLYGLATSSTVKDFLASWNISVHEWLKYYVYLRQLDNKKKGSSNLSASLVAFMVSAIWHGFYPGFFSFFFFAFVMDHWSKLAGPILNPYFNWMPSVVQNVLCTIFYYIGCSYFSIAFVLLNFCDFHQVYLTMNYALHIFFVGTLPLLFLIKPKRTRI